MHTHDNIRNWIDFILTSFSKCLFAVRERCRLIWFRDNNWFSIVFLLDRETLFISNAIYFICGRSPQNTDLIIVLNQFQGVLDNENNWFNAVIKMVRPARRISVYICCDFSFCFHICVEEGIFGRFRELHFQTWMKCVNKIIQRET